MNHLRYLPAAYTFLTDLVQPNGMFETVSADDKRQALLELPALVRAHGLGPVLTVWSERGTKRDAQPSKHMLHHIADKLSSVADTVAISSTASSARRTRAVLDFLDAVLHLLDGVIPKPSPPQQSPDAMVEPAPAVAQE